MAGGWHKLKTNPKNHPKIALSETFENCHPEPPPFADRFSEPKIRVILNVTICTMNCFFRSAFTATSPKLVAWNLEYHVSLSDIVTDLLFQIGVYGYIADVSRLKSRTSRVALVDLFLFLGYPLGVFLSDYIFKAGGFYLVNVHNYFIVLTFCKLGICVVFSTICFTLDNKYKSIIN